MYLLKLYRAVSNRAVLYILIVQQTGVTNTLTTNVEPRM